MKLNGACHCGKVKFTVNSKHPYPYNLCYCSICRKTAGSGGFVINLSAEYKTLEVQGREHITVYHAKIGDKVSPAERYFCKHCSANLWLYDARWPEQVHPFAGAIDSELPIPPERTHLMLGSKANWVNAPINEGDKQFQEYPDESIAAWHQRLNLEK